MAQRLERRSSLSFGAAAGTLLGLAVEALTQVPEKVATNAAELSRQ